MKQIQGIAMLVFLFGSAHCYAVGVPDTGQDTCYNDSVADGASASSSASIARDAGSHPRQDCRYGRDAAAAGGVLPKTGAGTKGFDYTKVANNGAALSSSAALGSAAAAWACTRDNVTGLTWEVKTAGNASELRYYSHTYRWYSTDSNTNGGSAGAVGSATCNATLPGNQCNTEAFIGAVNAIGLCSYSDWRLPSIRELRTLVYSDGTFPPIDATFFPNTVGLFFISGTSNGPNPALAWQVNMLNGITFPNSKSGNDYLRLVRGP